mgnify:CR=1 FL=1
MTPQGATLDDAVLELAGAAIPDGRPFAVEMEIKTENRTAGAKVAHAITMRHPNGLPAGTALPFAKRCQTALSCSCSLPDL